MAILRRELDELRTAKELAERDLNEEREEVDALKARCNALEMERQTRDDMGAAGGGDPTAMATLQADMQGLIVELTELSARNDELVMAKEEDMARTQRLEARVEEYKRMYERAKTELRSLKGWLMFCITLC
jgi:capsule polysaccharide export protein KpsE/RkpR